MAARKPSSTNSEKKRASKELLSTEQISATDFSLTPLPYPELVFGLVGPVGVNLDPVISLLVRELKTLNYSAKTVRLSKQIESFLLPIIVKNLKTYEL